MSSRISIYAIAAAVMFTASQAHAAESAFMEAQRALGGKTTLTVEISPTNGSSENMVVELFDSEQNYQNNQAMLELDVVGDKVTFSNISLGSYAIRISGKAGEVVPQINTFHSRDRYQDRNLDGAESVAETWDNLKFTTLSGNITKSIKAGEISGLPSQTEKAKTLLAALPAR